MKTELIRQLQGGLVVSCQAFENEIFYGPDYMVKMALAAKAGGARAIRASWPDNIKQIRNAVDLPIFGINKIMPEHYNKMEDVIITPTLESARAIVDAGSDIIAVDCTNRQRDPEAVRELIASIKQNLDILVMGEISTLEEGLLAESYGVDILSTTIAGYTPYSRHIEEPDYELIHDLVQKSRLPINAEGRFHKPEQVIKALKLGAWTVTVGSAITRPHFVTRMFVEEMEKIEKEIA